MIAGRTMQLYFNGKPMGTVSEVTYEINHDESVTELGAMRFEGSAVTEIDIGAVIPAADFDFDFSGLFPQEPAGASHETLVKRMHYGGRKGRSARRRLLAKAMPLDLMTEHLRYRGRATFLDETEALVTIKSVGFR